MINIISTSKARNMLPAFIKSFEDSDNVFVIGRREKPEAIILKFSSTFSKYFNDITNINSYSSSFNFLKDEPEIYSSHDILK